MTQAQYQKHLASLKKFFRDHEQINQKLSELENLVESSKIEWTAKAESKIITAEFSLPPEIVNYPHDALALFCDGACRGNPGPGSFAYMGQEKNGNILFQGSGVEMNTTNNRMELMGAIKSLQEVKELGLHDIATTLYSDSRYVVDGLMQWVPNWKSRGWKKSDGKAPENLDLWQTLEQISNDFAKLNLQWVKGHAGHPQNEFCDSLANQTLDEILS
jgi:ribonuclease HI